jgi:hypothetical protein
MQADYERAVVEHTIDLLTVKERVDSSNLSFCTST